FASTSLRCSYRYSPIDAPAPSELYTLSLHDALPILPVSVRASRRDRDPPAAARRHPLPDPVLRHLSRVDRGDLDAGVAGLDAGDDCRAAYRRRLGGPVPQCARGVPASA